MTLLEVNNQEVFETKAISVLIDYLWTCSKKFHYFFGALFFILTILISIYTGLRSSELILEIPIFVLGLFFLFYEIFEVSSIGFNAYFTMIWNYVDCFGTLILPPSIIAIWCGAEGDLKEWLLSFMIVYAYSRLISYFRVFDQTRKLIRTIIEIIRDMRSFAVILTFVTFGLALIFLQFDNSKTFGESLLEAYNLLYYSYDTTGYNVGQMFYFVVVTIIATMVLLNMLLALIWDSYARVQEKSVLTDSQELLDMIEENINMVRAIERLFGRFNQQQPVSRTSSDYERLRDDDHPESQNKNKKYMFFVEEAEEEEEQEVVTKVESQIIEQKKKVKNEEEVYVEGKYSSKLSHLLRSKAPKKKRLQGAASGIRGSVGKNKEKNLNPEKEETLEMNHKMTNLENKLERLENQMNQRFSELIEILNKKNN